MSFLSEDGVRNVVALLERSVTHELRHHAMLCLTSLVHCSTPELGTAAWEAGAIDVIATALQQWPEDTSLLGLALCAAVHVMIGPVPSMVEAAVECMDRHLGDVRLCQAGLRVMRHHAIHAPLPQLPRVATTLTSVMCKYRSDDTIQYYGAHTWIAILAMEPHELARDHGTLARFAIHECVIKVAAGTTHHSVLVNGQPWHAFVLSHLFPKLRSAA